MPPIISSALPLQFLALLRDVCLPIFLLISVGWLADRRFRLDLETLVKLNIYVFVPAFIFVRVTQSPLTGDLALRVMGFTLSLVASMALLSWLYARVRGLTSASRRSLQLSTMFYNCGNYGIPLMALAFPEIAALQVFVLMTMNIATFSLGTLLAASGHPDRPEDASSPSFPLQILLRQPALYAVGLALVVRGLDLGPALQNTFIWEPLVYGERALVSFALITLGVQLGQTRPPRLTGTLAWAVFLRLAGAPLIALALVPLFDFDAQVEALLILGAGTPTAVNAALLAHEFKGDYAFATGAVFYSTLLSLVSVASVLFLLRHA